MFFQSKKKRLWRARVPQTATHHAHSQHQQQHHHQQQQQQQQLLQHQEQQSHQQIHSTQRHYTHQNHSQQQNFRRQIKNIPKTSSESSSSQNLISVGDRQHSQQMIDYQRNVPSGFYHVNGGEEVSIQEDEDDQTMSSVTSMMDNSDGPIVDISVSLPRPVKNPRTTTTTEQISVFTKTTASAANVLLNCCGGGNSGNSYSNSEINLNLRNLNNNNNNSGENVNYFNPNEDKQQFRALTSKLKESQLTTLCQAVEKTSHASNGGGGGGHHQHQQHQDCVLIPRGAIMGDEPNVIACRLWRWADLKGPEELKSIPSCPNEKDRVYVCCNPNHWSRLCMPDIPPPPYQVFAMDRLKCEDLVQNENQIGGKQMRLQIPESLTTDGEESSTSSTWCQLAYWELAQRVGGRFPVENSSINIFSDQAQGDGMCLKTLAEQRKTETPESVLKTRQKIGLGVTLSQEADGVWLYNRSLVPVFVHSPTLNDVDYWYHVSKVPPGYCLRAFDNYRAKSQSLVWPPQIAGSQTGPVDTFSMRISFAKGWGPNYSRQDVTGCPCWLEVLLTRR